MFIYFFPTVFIFSRFRFFAPRPRAADSFRGGLPSTRCLATIISDVPRRKDAVGIDAPDAVAAVLAAVARAYAADVREKSDFRTASSSRGHAVATVVRPSQRNVRPQKGECSTFVVI